jgi:acyl-CoA dehydrogenase
MISYQNCTDDQLAFSHSPSIKSRGAPAMHFGLTEEQEMIVSTVRSFVENEIYPHEEMVEKTGQVPHELGEELKQKCIDLGFYACNFPESVGGAGLGHLDFTLVERELGRGSMALNHFFGRPQNILMACEGEQKEKYLLPAVRGEKMDALAMTEPDAGSDVRGMKCQAVRDGGDWVINGSKHFISGAEHADFFIVFVATGVDETPKGPKKRITCFLVDRGHAWFRSARRLQLRQSQGLQELHSVLRPVPFAGCTGAG